MKIAIVGLGVMGGSLLQTLSNDNTFSGELFVVSRSAPSAEWALSQGAKAVFEQPEQLPSDCDMVFLTTPSHVLPKMAQNLLHLQASCLISDMASSKGEVVPQLAKILQGRRYLSCHPMCGSEKTGLDGAKAELYHEKTVILTPHDERSASEESDLRAFWEARSCKVLVLDPLEHDRSVAWVSHMPHLVIPALVQAISKGQKDCPQVFKVAGTGLRDISRLAGSNPELWRDIFLENKQSLHVALKGVLSELQQLDQVLEQSDDTCGPALQNYIQQAREIHCRESLSKI